MLAVTGLKKKTLIHCWWKYCLIQPLWKTVWRDPPSKVRIELPDKQKIPFHAIYPRIQNINSESYMHIYVHCSTKFNSQDSETTQMANDKRIDGEIMVHRHSEILGCGYEKR